ncbi:MAG TPA: hypothetical protein DCY13_01300 [Verrucomicrobiales bacterium]|nr:hypothetical protein [Verrucomicrobiales bacterium]
MNYLPLFAQATTSSWWPFAVLFISVAFIVFAITKLRMHAFLALIVAAVMAGWLSAGSLKEMVDSIGLVTTGFGNTAAGVGVVIALAAIIGMCLMDSGAADQIVRKFMKVFGEERAGWALLASGFFLSIPVFFDTVFFLLIPLARMLAIRTGKDYTLYVLAIGGGGAITHSIVPPTPGPLLVGEFLGLDLGKIMVTGFIAGLVPAVGALYYAKWCNRSMPLPVRATTGSSLDDLKASTEKPASELPSFFISILPVILPAILLAAFSFVDMIEKQGIRTELVASMTQQAAGAPLDQAALKTELSRRLADPQFFSGLHGALELLGNKIMALAIGALIALGLVIRQCRLSWQSLADKCSGPLETAGVIILITSAGGAFGLMIRESGIGELIQVHATGLGINYVILAWFVTAVIRIAQGSATVSMITGAGLMAAIIGDGSGLGFDPVYIFLAIGFGSITCSWMNDSGFWIVGKLSGFTEKETLKGWTVMLTIIAVIGLVETFLFSKLIPYPFGQIGN